MILTCPACATSYFVPDEAIGPNGRRVRCKSCGHDWRASLEDAPLELEPATGAVAPVATESAEEAPPAETLADTPAPELPRAFRAKAERKRRLRQAAAAGVAWAAAAAVALGLLAGALLFREEIARAFPPAAGVYKALGLKVNTVGLQFEAQRARTAPHDPGKVVVSAVVRNVRDGEIVTPPIYVALLDARGAVVASRIERLDAPPVLPGKVQGFAVVIPDPEGKAVGMTVDFVLAPSKPVQPKPGPQAGPKAQPREDGGLRR